MINKKLSRREFIDRSAKGATGLLGYSLLGNSRLNAKNENSDKSTVVVVNHDDMCKIETINSSKKYNVDQDVAQIMMDTGIRQLTGMNDIGEAWKSFFPGITQEKVISIKINCIARQNNINGLASHPEFINTIINGLTSMQVDGESFPEENIIVWDRSEYEMEQASFTINKSDTGVKCYGTRYEIMRGGTSTGGYSTLEKFTVTGKSQYLSKILVEESDYLINTCLLKDHIYSGVTFSLKNHYGTCYAPIIIHDGNCNPAIPELNILPPIREKQVLSICDAAYGIINGGPMGFPQKKVNKLLLSQDPVAHDTICYETLKAQGTSSYTLAMATHIETAASEPYNLGTNDLEKINLIEIDIPSTGIKNNNKLKNQPYDFRLFQNYPNPFNSQTSLTYQLYNSSNVKLDIFNINGELMETLVHEKQLTGHYRINWDGKSMNHSQVPSGTYLARLQINNFHHTIKMQLIK